MLTVPFPALIGISFASLTVIHAPAPDLEQLDTAAAEAQARLIEDTEEWEIADEEGGDGGEAVKLPSIDQMRSDKVFEQGMRRADKVEEKSRRGRGGGGGSGRGGYGGRGGGSSSQNGFPPLQPSRGGPGVTQFHNQNKKRQREKAPNGGQQKGFVAPHQRGGGKQIVKGPKKEDVPLPEQMKNRLKILEDEDADYFTI